MRQEGVAPLRYVWRADVVARNRLPALSAVQALAVATMPTHGSALRLGPKIVYAVTGSDAVYRLTEGLQLDERVAIGPNSNP